MRCRLGRHKWSEWIFTPGPFFTTGWRECHRCGKDDHDVFI